MSLTQPRAFGAFAGRAYGSFEGRTRPSREIGELTQWRTTGTGRRYGAFSGRSEQSRQVGELTQGRSFGAFSGARYGSFTGKARPASRDVGTLTQWRAFGTGRRYGAFARTVPVVHPTVSGGPSRISYHEALRRQQLSEDETILLVIAGAMRLF